MAPFDKKQLLSLLIREIATRIERLERSAKEAHTEATHEQNKAESKYDTRGLEASYLAEGQTLQAAELERDLLQLHSFPIQTFHPKDAVALGALVELRQANQKGFYFLAPCAGGTELKFSNTTVLVITPQSPLGDLLVGKKAGATVTLQIRREKTSYLLYSVH